MPDRLAKQYFNYIQVVAQHYIVLFLFRPKLILSVHVSQVLLDCLDQMSVSNQLKSSVTWDSWFLTDLYCWQFLFLNLCIVLFIKIAFILK
jgi:hypothetical protein